MPAFRDQSLIPSNAVRLAALGTLSERDRRFGELATEVRGFIARMIGPTIDVLGTSLEALRHEGLIESTGPRGGPGQSLTADSLVRLTDSGRAALRDLLRGQLRAPLTDLSRLVVALKLRFLHLLDAAERHSQVEMLIELTTSDHARLVDLRAQPLAREGAFADWLDQEIRLADGRLAWYRALQARV